MWFKHFTLGVLRDSEPAAPGGGEAPPPSPDATPAADPPPAQPTPEQQQLGQPKDRRAMLRSLRPQEGEPQKTNGAPAPPTEPPQQAQPESPEAKPEGEQPPEQQTQGEKTPLDEIDFDNIDFDEPQEEPEKQASEAQAQPEGEESPEKLAEQERHFAHEFRNLLGLTDEQWEKFQADPKNMDKLEHIALKSNRGKKMLNSFKALRELEKGPDEGGVGYMPTPEELREGFKQSRGFQNLLHDIDALADNPERTQDVLGFMFGSEDQPVETAPLMAQALPGYLAQNNPQAFQHLRGVMLNGLIGEIEHAAQNETDAGRRPFLSKLGGALRYWVNPQDYARRYQGQQQGQQPNGQAQPNLDDHPEFKKLREENERYRQQMSQQQQAQFNQARQGFEQEKHKVVDGLFRQAFKKVDIDPRVLDPILAQHTEKALAAINQNPMLSEQVDDLIGRAIRRNDRAAFDQALQLVRRAAEVPVKRLGPEIKETLSLVYKPKRAEEAAQAQEQREKFQSGQQQYRQPGSAGAPVPGGQSAVQKYDPSSGLSLREWRSQQLAAARPVQ